MWEKGELNMDPITIAHMARIRQQEILQMDTREDNRITVGQLVWQLGDALAALGHKVRARHPQPQDDSAR
jgi:hypothetical protein